MRILKSWKISDRRAVEELMRRSFFDPKIERQVKAIVDDVRKRGDKAVAEYTQRFDGVRVAPRAFRVPRAVIGGARRGLDRTFVSAVRRVERNLLLYHRRQKPGSWRMDAGHGSSLGERWVPLQRVGVYVPGGKAPLVSTVLMGVVPAKVAGVEEIAVASPPGRNGEVNPFILAVCEMLGVKEVYRIGGAQAIAAMALGTETVRKVDKVFGPGNVYVTTAKRILYGRVGIDMLAGESEVLVLADESADPAFVAADLLSQAEHGVGRDVCILATNSLALAEKVRGELESLAGSGEEGGFDTKLLAAITILVTKTVAEGIGFANDFAAEHVEVMVRNAASVARRIRNAGAVFVGRYSPVPVGDFYAGPNHVLPTGGAARFLSGLSVSDFMKRISVVSYTKKSLHASLPAVSKMAEVEGLRGHAEAIQVRFERRRK